MEELNPQWLFNGLFTLIGVLGGWLLNSVKDSIEELRDQDERLTTKVQAIEVLVAGSYVKREDMEKISHEIFKKLDRIESKLDQKADK